jgi:hypothetical protein
MTDHLYELRYHDGSVRFRFTIKDSGIEVTDTSIGFRRFGRYEAHAYEEIASIALTSFGIGATGMVGQCTITFRGGSKYVVTSSDSLGRGSLPTNTLYSEFVRDLHARISASGAARRIHFQSGWDDTKHMVQLVLVGFLTLIMIPAPLIALFTGELKPMIVTVSAAVLLWPMWLTVSRNKPARYSPANPPNLVA